MMENVRDECDEKPQNVKPPREKNVQLKHTRATYNTTT